MLPRPTIKKLVREIIGTTDAMNDAGLKVPAAEQEAWLTQLATTLSQQERVEATVRDGFYIALKIRSTAASGRDLEWFMIHFYPYKAMAADTDRMGLWIADATYRRRRKAETESPVREVQQLFQFVDAVKAKQDQVRLRAQRSTKLANLRQRGLKSRLIDLGAEHGFSFALGENKRDVNLSIRVGGKKSAYHLSFPKGKLEAVLKQIPELVTTLESMRELGIAFRTNNKPWAHRQGPWIEPESNEEVA